jgi:hypothetical protein
LSFFEVWIRPRQIEFPGNYRLRPLCETGKKNEILCKRLADSRKFWTENLSDFVRCVVKPPFMHDLVF